MYGLSPQGPPLFLQARRYEIVYEETPGALGREVQKRLNLGWQPLGGVATSMCEGIAGGFTAWWAQAMVMLS